ncbi:MAG: hypothetical protein WC795_02525 [Candidatus Paceibacterota bacterium]|jgi:hypothetical protein
MEVKNILIGASSLKVVLNGGKLVLDDATVPFQIAFDQSVAKKNPTHILVIDVTDTGFYDDGSRRSTTCNFERSVFKLEPTNYLQFHKPGVHHLIFMLVSGGMNKSRQQEFLGKRGYSYKNTMIYDEIENNDAVPDQIAFVEVIVEVPKEFFAKVAETKLGKAFYAWNNRWFNLQPIDQCQYRKRMFVSLTIQPFVWLFMCLVRLIVGIIILSAMFVFKFVLLMLGIQFVRLFGNAKLLLIDFALLYPKEKWTSIFESDNWKSDILDYEQTAKDSSGPMDAYEYKVLSIFGFKVYTPITIGGFLVYAVLLIFYSGCIYLNLSQLAVREGFVNLLGSLVSSFAFGALFAFTALPTIKRKKEYRNNWDKERISGSAKIFKAFWQISLSMVSVALILYLVFQVNWMAVLQILATFVSVMIIFGLMSAASIFMLTRYKLWRPIGKVVWMILSPIVWLIAKPTGMLVNLLFKETNEKPISKLNPREVWLEKSFDLKALPQKVDVFKAPPPSTKIHKFRISFWSLKAKVCKPFPKGW